MNTAHNTLRGIAGALIVALTTSGSFSRVDSYLQAHCSVDSELAQNIIDESG